MVDTQRKSMYGNSRKSAGNCHILPLWELVPSFSSRRICCCVATQLLLRRDVSDATSGRNFFRIDGEVMNKDWNPQALNRKNAFLLNTFCVFLKKFLETPEYGRFHGNIWQITPKNKELPYPLQLCNQRDYWLIWQYGNSWKKNI